MAASLAERENLSDQIAGVALSDEPAEVADILIDLTRRETQAFSINLARSVVSSFEGQINLINNPHRFAGFRVLQAPDVPSILLEIGFMSNKDDEKTARRSRMAAQGCRSSGRGRASLSARRHKERRLTAGRHGVASGQQTGTAPRAFPRQFRQKPYFPHIPIAYRLECQSRQ